MPLHFRRIIPFLLQYNHLTALLLTFQILIINRKYNHQTGCIIKVTFIHKCINICNPIIYSEMNISAQ